MLWATRRHREAIDRADAGLRQIEPYLKNVPEDAIARQNCLKLHGNRALGLAGLGRHRDSAADWMQVVELSPEPVPAGPRVQLAIELVSSGQVEPALKQAQLVKSAQGLSGDACYNFGCLYALAAGAVTKDRGLSTVERERSIDSHIADAIRWLNSAFDAGFFRDSANRDHAMKDDDLKILRDRPEFRRFVEPPGPDPANKGK